MDGYSDYQSALRAIVKFLAAHSAPHERQSMSIKLAESANGKEHNLGFSFRHVGLLFHPNSPSAAAELTHRIEIARNSGELQSIFPAAQAHILATDLLTWPECPPVTADNPLSYWLPVSAATIDEIPSAIEKPTVAAATAHVPQGATKNDWRDIARTIADELDTRDEKAGASGSITDIAERVAKEMRARKINGPQGMPLSGATVKREALQGGRWTRPRDRNRVREPGETREP